MSTSVIVQTDRGAILRAVIEFGEAWARSDSAAIEASMAAEYAHTDSFGDRYSREEYLAYVAQPRRVDRIGFEDLEIYPLGHTAVVTGKNVVVRSTEQGPCTSCIRFTQVWVLEGETWKRAAFHACEIDAD